MALNLPSRSEVGLLDPEIANEGEKVVHLNHGEKSGFAPPPIKHVTPDWSEIKSIRHLFGRTGYDVYPAWVYHAETGEARLIQDHKSAMELGIYYRDASNEEKGRYGISAVWDWKPDCPWRPKPEKKVKFDPSNPGTGKTYVAPPVDHAAAQSAAMSELAKAIVGGNQSLLRELAGALKGLSENAPAAGEQGNMLSAHTERTDLEKKATSLGIKIDGRWSAEKLRGEVDKAERA
jgi:hypothetical protein